MKFSFNIHEPLLKQLMGLTKKSRQGTIELVADRVMKVLPATHEIDKREMLRRQAMISSLEFDIIWSPYFASDVEPSANVVVLNQDGPTTIEGALVSCAYEDGKVTETGIELQKDLATIHKGRKQR